MAGENGKSGPGWSTAIVFSLITMVVGGLTTFYTTRDQTVAGLRAELQLKADALRQEQRERFLSKEEWANWKADNRARQDAMYYGIMTTQAKILARIDRK